jgi:hypothetical protein
MITSQLHIIGLLLPPCGDKVITLLDLLYPNGSLEVKYNYVTYSELSTRPVMPLRGLP